VSIVQRRGYEALSEPAVSTREFERRIDGGIGALDREARERPTVALSGASLALANMRGIVIVVVLAFHSVLAYLGSLTPSSIPFDASPFPWRAFPIIDDQRWFGFDIFCAWQDVYLMSLMFFLSALFAWPSLARKGSRKFLADRLLRLGVPFVFGLAVVTPLALYPVYRTTASDPGLVAYGRHFLALPFWPNGPMWFLWLLLALSAFSAAVYRFAPHWIAYLGRLSSDAAARPGRYFVGLATAVTLAYVPLALAFTPWAWSEHGPLGLQLSRPLLYSAYYLAGLGVGAYGLDRGLLAAKGMLAQRWRRWALAAMVAFLLWMGLTAASMNDNASLALQFGAAVSYGVAGVSGCFFVLAACLKFCAFRSRLLASLSNNAFGMYLIHYPFVVWLQFALLGLTMLALAKAAIVLGATLVLSFAATAAFRLSPFGSLLIGEQPRAGREQRSRTRRFDGGDPAGGAQIRRRRADERTNRGRRLKKVPEIGAGKGTESRPAR
jgi:glucan biosynthesis protein C